MTLETLINDLAEAQRTFDLKRHGKERAHERGAPATDEQLNALEARLGKPLPASYRAFLALHDGWANFEADGKLLGTSDHEQKWVKAKVEFWNSMWEPDEPNPFKSGALPVMFSPDTLTFIEFDDMSESRTFADFTDYLQAKLESLQRLNASQR